MSRLINNDIDLYYQLNINQIKSNDKNKKSSDKIKHDDKNEEYNIMDYEKLMESMYDDIIINDKDIEDLCEYKRFNFYDNHNFNPNCNDPQDANINIKKFAKKRVIMCDYCNDDDLIEDTSHGILVCRNCGQVVENLMDLGAEWTHYNDDNKKDMNRCSHPISQLLPQSSAATTISGACSARIRTLHGWSLMPYKERSLNEVFKTIQVKCHIGKIPKCIEDDAKIMYKNVSDCKHIKGKNKGKAIIIRGKNRSSVIGASVLFACRKKDKSRSPKEIAELFGLKYTEITKGCKIFQKLAKLKNMELRSNSTKPEHFILRFCDELKIKSEYTEQAIQISNNVQKLQIAAVHTPLSLATGSIYLMIQINNLAIHKKVIADKFNVSQVTIAKAYKKLEPFVNLLTHNDLCDRLSLEIIKYQNQIDLPNKLKSKFIRFNIDTMKALSKPKDILYSILVKDDVGNYYIDDKLIVEHNIEIDNKIKQLDNERIRLNINYTEDVYFILKQQSDKIIKKINAGSKEHDQNKKIIKIFESDDIKNDIKNDTMPIQNL